MATKPPTRVITAHVPVPLAKEVDAIAERMERTRGWVVKQAITNFIAVEEWKHEQILQGLADIDAGRTHSHEAMIAWSKTLSKKQ